MYTCIGINVFAVKFNYYPVLLHYTVFVLFNRCKRSFNTYFLERFSVYVTFMTILECGGLGKEHLHVRTLLLDAINVFVMSYRRICMTI